MQKEDKERVVAELTEKLRTAETLFVADYRGLTMPADEQRVRMRSMRRLVQEFNVYRWAGAMLLDAARLRQRQRVSARIFAHQRGAGIEA